MHSMQMINEIYTKKNQETDKDELRSSFPPYNSAHSSQAPPLSCAIEKPNHCPELDC